MVNNSFATPNVVIFEMKLMSMHGIDFAFDFFQPKGEKNKGELEEAA
jgi:hypothetical protein